MSVSPLFVADMTKLKAALRMTGAGASDASALLDQAVRDVRLSFIRRLTAAVCATIAATTHTDTPTTDAEVRKSVAESIEIKWVRLLIMRTMPVVVMDGGALNQIWNQEAPFRSASQDDLAAEMRRLEAEIEEGLEILADGGLGDDETGVNAADIGPACPKIIGRDVFRRRGPD